MTLSLRRPCLDCGKAVRGKPRCRDCQAVHQRAKRQLRPDLDDQAERERRRRLVAHHRATVGDWCPGTPGHPAHPCADLVADHLVEVAAGGPATGPLRVLCRAENGRRSGNVRREILTILGPPDPSPGEVGDTHRLSTGVDNGPVVA
jgi:hypothetical protein